MAERKAVTAAIRSRYQGASKKEKGKILAEFIELTGYHRVYARSVLRTVERKLVREQPTPAESKSGTGEEPKGLRPAGADHTAADLDDSRLHLRQASGDDSTGGDRPTRVFRRAQG